MAMPLTRTGLRTKYPSRGFPFRAPQKNFAGPAELYALLFVEDVLLDLLPVLVAAGEHLRHERVQFRSGGGLVHQIRIPGSRGGRRLRGGRRECGPYSGDYRGEEATHDCSINIRLSEVNGCTLYKVDLIVRPSC
jgi:hypothetical protein